MGANTEPQEPGLAYDPQRVIEKLSRRLGDALADQARAEAVAENLLVDRNRLLAQLTEQQAGPDTRGPTVDT